MFCQYVGGRVALEQLCGAAFFLSLLFFLEQTKINLKTKTRKASQVVVIKQWRGFHCDWNEVRPL